MRYLTLVLLLLCSLLVTPTYSDAAYVVRKGKLHKKRDVATKSAEEHFAAGQKAHEKKDWHEMLDQFHVVATNWPVTPLGKDALYFEGVAYMGVKDYEFANDRFTDYIQQNPNGKQFENAIQRKLEVAQAFREGSRRHLFGMAQMPKWLPASSTGIEEIYDEVVDTLPGSPLAAKALFEKGAYLRERRKYSDAIESFQRLVQRYPMDERVSDAYVMICQSYYDQCLREENNPDLLPLAEIAIRHFKRHLPRDPKIEAAEALFTNLREACANGLYETGRFYERTKKKKASVLYYVSAVRRFPDTEVAKRCKERLNVLEKEVADLGISKEILS